MKDKMNHQIAKLSIVLTAVFLTASCCSDEPTVPSFPTEQRVPLQLSSVISGLTRASGTAWESTDQIGVFTTLHDAQTATQHGTAYDANVLYVIDATADGYNTATEGSLDNAKAFTPSSSPIYLPADGSSVDVYAYHPYVSTITENGVIAVSVVTASQSLATVDLMTAKTASTVNPINALNPSAALLFSHRLSKVTVNVTNGTGYAASEITNHVSINITGTPNTANYNLYTGTFSSFDTGKADITLQKQATATSGYLETHSAIILPNETNDNAAAAGRTLTFKVGDTANGYYIYTIPADKAFEKGKNTIYNITLSPTGLSITAAIRDWDSITTSETLK